MKRVFDVVFATIVLIILFIPLVVTGLAIIFVMGSPVIFKQERAGRFGKPFTIYKFRTMTNDTNPAGELLSDVDRQTKLGTFLRRSSIDELPELVNVIKGDMSLVGPRPLLLQYVERYDSEQKRRLDVRPGITGLAQVKGRNSIEWGEKFALDLEYIDNWSMTLDLKIIWLTAFGVLTGKGVNSSDDVTMSEFLGRDHGK